MRFPIEWDTARRSYIILTGQFRGAWFVKYITDKIKALMKDSEACAACRCNFPVDAMQRDTFFLYVVIDGESKEDVERCDAHIFGGLLKELEGLRTEHRISHLSFPEARLKVAYVSVEAQKE